MRFARLFAVFVLTVVLPCAAGAQAWVPPKGEGAVSFTLQDLYVKDHIATTTHVDAGHVNTIVALADVSYGLTEKVAVDLAVPFVAARYHGNFAHPGTDIDDGTYHHSFTDMRVSVRYNLWRGGAVITPYVGTIVPTHDYAFYGHAAFGEGLREVQVGTYIAKTFTAGVPGLFLSGRVGYGFVEKVLDISHNRSQADLEAGYFITPRLNTFFTLGGQITHGGIDFPLGGLPALPAEFKLVHDIIQRVNYLHAGGGLAYSLSDSIDLFGSFTRLVAGRNGHALNRGISVGVSMGFSRN